MEASYVDVYNGRSPAAGVFFYSHVTDAIRLVVLFKHGGTYLDFDMLPVQNLFAFRNALGVECPNLNTCLSFAAAAVFGVGHPFLWAAMLMFGRAYNSGSWACVGPNLVSGVALEWERLGLAVCENAARPSLPWGSMKWYGIHIYPTVTFYPIFYGEMKEIIFNGASSKQTHIAALIRNSTTVHVWSSVGWDPIQIQHGSVLQDLLFTRRVLWDGRKLLGQRQHGIPMHGGRVALGSGG